jgi:4-amino-4-deoxy-L-arabinose transferase-like glycosyltransferase
MMAAMSQCTIPEEKTRTGQPASGVPPRDRGELLITLAVFAGALLYLWPLHDFLSFNADEGITLASAERILRGQVAYRDFFTFVTPGSPYLMALWFKLFGNSFVVARSVLLVYAGLFGAITYRLTRRVYGRAAALFAAALLVFGCMPSRFLVIHNWDSTLFALLTLYCAQRVLETPTRFWCLSVGCGTALTFLTEQPKGAGLLLGLVIAAAIFWLSPRGPRRVPMGNIGSAALGFAIPLTATCAYFASNHALAAMLEAWSWPMRHYSVVNRLSFGTVPMSAHDLRDLYFNGPLGTRAVVVFASAPMFLVSALAVLVLASTLYAIVLRCNAAPSHALDVRVLGGSVFFGVFLATLATGRADLNHLLYLTPLFVYLVPSVLDIQHPSLRSLYKVRPIIACLLLFSFTGFGLVTVLRALGPATRAETRRGTTRFGSPDEVLRYVDDNVAEGQHLYVYPYQAVYSYMTGTVNPTRFEFLFQGMNTPAQYESVIHDLAADRTPLVLLDPSFAGDKVPETWPSTPAEALATDPVTDFILQHYRMCRSLNLNAPHLWRFYAMVRKDLPCPTGRQAAE